MEYLVLANVILTALVLVLLAYPKIALRRKSEQGSSVPTQESGYPVEALPAGCEWPEKFDEFDGVMERFVCRAHGESFLRRRV